MSGGLFSFGTLATAAAALTAAVADAAASPVRLTLTVFTSRGAAARVPTVSRRLLRGVSATTAAEAGGRAVTVSRRLLRGASAAAASNLATAAALEKAGGTAVFVFHFGRDTEPAIVFRRVGIPALAAAAASNLDAAAALEAMPVVMIPSTTR